MPAEPPRTAVHQVQHLIFDGCRILRTRAANSLSPETLEALDAMLAQLEPIEGFPIVPVSARHYGLAHEFAQDTASRSCFLGLALKQTRLQVDTHRSSPYSRAEDALCESLPS